MEAWVENYIGIPYLEHGRTHDGCDCWGLVRLVLAEVFLHEVPSLTNDYGPVEASVTARLIDQTSAGIDARRVADPLPGDIAVIRVLGVPSHVGVIVGPWHVLHVKRGTQAIVERLDVNHMSNRIEGYYRVL